MDQNYLDRYLEDINLLCVPENSPIYIGYSLFNITKQVTFVFIVQLLFDDQDIAIYNICGLKVIQFMIQIECLQATKCLSLDNNLDHDPDSFALCTR